MCEHAADATYDRGPGYTSAMGAGLGFQRDLGGWAPGQMTRFLENRAYTAISTYDKLQRQVQLNQHRDHDDALLVQKRDAAEREMARASG